MHLFSSDIYTVSAVVLMNGLPVRFLLAGTGLSVIL